jgi:Ca-activated chloride channel family protein
MLNGAKWSEASGLSMRTISRCMGGSKFVAQILRFAQDDRQASPLLLRAVTPRVSISLSAICILTLFPSLSLARTGSAREMLRQGNRLYGENQYAEAVNKYNEVLVEQPQAVEPKFNKANSYFRLDDLSEAMDLYQQVAAESKNMSLVAKAKYNLGNCFFQRGTKQRDSNLQKAVEDMETSIANWRQVLDIDPQNKKAAKNIEVARLTIKDILDQMKKQQQDQKNQKDKQGQQNQQPQQKQGQQQDPSKSQKDPNQPQDPNQAKKAEPKSDPNQTKPQPKPVPEQQDKQQEAKAAPDATAREIIDTEQRQKKERETLRQKGQYQEVEKDW